MEFRESFLKIIILQSLTFEHEQLNIIFALLASIPILPKPNPGLWMLKANQDHALKKERKTHNFFNDPSYLQTF